MNKWYRLGKKFNEKFHRELLNSYLRKNNLYATSNSEGGKSDIWWTFLIIGVITFVCSILGSLFGKVIGNVVKKVAPIIGGLVLIGIGISIVVEHLL